MSIDLNWRRVKEMQLLLFITWGLRWYHWWWFVGKWRGGLTSNRGMLYLSVVFESSSVKKLMNALSTCQKRLTNCRSTETAVSSGRHLINGFVQKVWGKNRVWQSRDGGEASYVTWVSVWWRVQQIGRPIGHGRPCTCTWVRGGRKIQVWWYNILWLCN